MCPACTSRMAADVLPLAGTYGYRPLANHDWLPAFEAARANLAPGARFLDVGCGLGVKVLRAASAGLDAWGLELRPRYAELARKLGAQVIDGDARQWDGYGEFDCVFLFHLLRDYEPELDLERQVAGAMRPGTVLMLFGVWRPEWEVLGPNCWRVP
jgi:SAM-dependent methyltransferase